MLIDDIYVEADISIPEQTILQEVAQERMIWAAEGKTLSLIRIRVDDGGIVIEAFERSPIRRVRRITGYLAPIESFNDAKQAELRARLKHSY